MSDGSDTSPEFRQLLWLMAKCGSIPLFAGAVGLYVIIRGAELVFGISPAQTFGPVLTVSAGLAALLYRNLWRDYFSP